MDIIEEYLTLVDNNEWEKALPVIKKIVELNPKIQTSWFNYGVCLDALSKHDEASKTFMKAYEMDPDDFGAQYRVFRSLSLAKDENGFASFLKVELKKTPDILELMLKDEDFKSILQFPQVQNVIMEFEA